MSVVESKTTLVALQSLKSASVDAARASQRLATGLRINQASDDPAGLGKASALKAEIASFGQVKKNINAALGDLDRVNNGLTSISDYLVEMRTLALASAGESNTAVRANYNTQFAELIIGIGEIVAATKFADTAVLASGGSTQEVQVGIGGAASDSKSLVFTAADATTLGVGALVISTATAAATAISTVETAIDSVGSKLAKVGGFQSSLENYADLADSSVLSKTGQYGDIMNADLALEASNLAAAKIRQDAATAVLAQANSMNRNIADYLLNGALG